MFTTNLGWVDVLFSDTGPDRPVAQIVNLQDVRRHRQEAALRPLFKRGDLVVEKGLFEAGKPAEVGTIVSMPPMTCSGAPVGRAIVQIHGARRAFYLGELAHAPQAQLPCDVEVQP